MTPRLRIYIAGANERREELHAIGSRLVRAGVGVTSTWLEGLDPPGQEATAAERCLDEIRHARGVLSFTGEGGTGGRHVELGYALALGLWCWIVGPRENVFHHLSRVVDFPTVEDWAEYMGIDLPPAHTFAATVLRPAPGHPAGEIPIRPWRWQCFGCGYVTNDAVGKCNGGCFDDSGRSCDARACPSCGRLHYWTGSVDLERARRFPAHDPDGDPMDDPRFG